jgi:hypothetical protein
MIRKNTARSLVILECTAVLILGAQTVYAGVDVNINLGAPPLPVVVAPQPVYAPAPVPVPVVVEPNVEFIFPERLGFYVAVGVPYDLVYLGNSYFVFRGGRWLRAPNYRGPWVEQRYRDLPPVLRRHRVERIRECRDKEYVVYRRDTDHYRGRHFRAERDWKEQHRELKEQRKEERQFDKEQWKDEKRWAKEQRKENKRLEKEQRQDDKRWEKEERKEHRHGHGD